MVMQYLFSTENDGRRNPAARCPGSIANGRSGGVSGLSSTAMAGESCSCAGVQVAQIRFEALRASLYGGLVCPRAGAYDRPEWPYLLFAKVRRPKR